MLLRPIPRRSSLQLVLGKLFHEGDATEVGIPDAKHLQERALMSKLCIRFLPLTPAHAPMDRGILHGGPVGLHQQRVV